MEPSVSDFFRITVRDLSPAHTCLRGSPFGERAVRVLAKLAKLDDWKKGNVDDLDAQLRQVVEAAGERGAARALPPNKKVAPDRDNLEVLVYKDALLHQVFPSKKPPAFTYLRADVALIASDVSMPKSRPQPLLWALRVMEQAAAPGGVWEPMQRILYKNKTGHISFSFKAKCALTDRKKKSATLHALIAPEYLAHLTVGQTWTTGANEALYAG